MATKPAIRGTSPSLAQTARDILTGRKPGVIKEDSREQFTANIQAKRGESDKMQKWAGSDPEDLGGPDVDDAASGIGAAKNASPQGPHYPGTPPNASTKEPQHHYSDDTNADGKKRAKADSSGVVTEEEPDSLPTSDDDHKNFEHDPDHTPQLPELHEEGDEDEKKDDDEDKDEKKDDDKEEKKDDVKEERNSRRFRSRRVVKEEDDDEKKDSGEKDEKDDDEDNDKAEKEDVKEDASWDAKYAKYRDREPVEEEDDEGSDDSKSRSAEDKKESDEDEDDDEKKEDVKEEGFDGSTTRETPNTGGQAPDKSGVVGGQGDDDARGDFHQDIPDAQPVSSLVKQYVNSKTGAGAQVDEDVKALFRGESLSSQFQKKAKTIFEAAVTRKAIKIAEQVEKHLQRDFTREEDSLRQEMATRMDDYLTYMVEGWVKENEIAIEKGLRAELVEDFIGGLKTLFVENYIDVPEDKVNVIEELAEKVEALEQQINEETENNVSLNKQLFNYKKEDIIRDVSEDLTDTQYEKLKSLSEGITYKSDEDFEERVTVLRENYFPKNGKPRVAGRPGPSGLDEDESVDDGSPDKKILAESTDPLIRGASRVLSKQVKS